MAKKKRKAGKSKRRSSKEQGPEMRFDRRMMERAMKQFGAVLSGGGESPLDQAQELVYEALEADDPRRRAALARQALQVSPDCADAYVLLAEQAESAEEAVELYRQGLAAGERAIGKEEFRELEGDFWGFLETRPYMRARYGLAQTLWEIGRREEAVAHYRDMLRLNPNDNQGVRYQLSDCLLDLELHDELEALLDQYEAEDSASWAYTSALLEFRRHGDSERARELLAAAAQVNPHVPEYLVGNRPIPADSPQYIQIGEEDEAVNYAASQLRHWRNTPGAVSWVRKTLHVPLPEQPARRPVSWQRMKSRVLDLPESDEYWQVDIRRPPAGVNIGGELERPWVVLVVESEEAQLLAAGAETSRPSPSEAWEHLLKAMFDAEEPHRPAGIEVRLKSLHSNWREKLKEIGVECILTGTLDSVDEVLRQMASFTAFGRRPFGEEATDEGRELDPQEVPHYADTVWQVDVRRLPTWVGGDGEPARPWAILVVDSSNGLVVGQDLSMESPTEDSLWHVIVGAMGHPMVGDPHRPGVIQFSSPAYAEALQARAADLGIHCETAEELPVADAVFEGLAEHLSEEEGLRSLIDVPGMSLEQVGCFYRAAAEFYRRAPWRMVPGDVPIRIQCDKFSNGTWFGVVMGQSGMTLGLALYEDADFLQELIHGDVSEEEHARRASALSVTYDEQFAVHAKELDAAERHGWPVAGPEAYPMAMRVNPGRAIRPPLNWELELLEGCLRALPDFLAAGKRTDRVAVPAASSRLELALERMD